MKSKQWKSAGLICLMFIGGLSSCTNGGQGSKGDALDAQPIVGSVEILNGDSVWVCNLSALKDTLVLPLSYFADELQIVKLDNRDEALVPVRNVIVSDNYILVWGKDQTPFKLFDKSGKFLGNVGAFGQGPGEYQLIYDAQIDEAGGRIYLLPWNARSLLAYDLKGQAVQNMNLIFGLPVSRSNDSFHITFFQQFDGRSESDELAHLCHIDPIIIRVTNLR